MSDQRKWVLRVEDNSYKRLKKVADIENLNITTAGDLAINMFADSIEYSNENLIRMIDKQPALKLEKDLFSKLFRIADRETIEAVVEILKKGQVDFDESNFENLDKKLSEINKNGCDFVVPILRVNINKKPNEEIREKINEFFKKVKTIPCKINEQMLLDKSFKQDDSTQLKLLFFILKKEDNGDDK